MQLKEIILYASVATQMAAAALWCASTVVKVSRTRAESEERNLNTDGYIEPALVDTANDSDVVASLKRQAQWSGWAALATSLGILLQVAATVMQHSCKIYSLRKSVTQTRKCHSFPSGYCY